jgi:hypothetical protein
MSNRRLTLFFVFCFHWAQNVQCTILFTVNITPTPAFQVSESLRIMILSTWRSFDEIGIEYTLRPYEFMRSLVAHTCLLHTSTPGRFSAVRTVSMYYGQVVVCVWRALNPKPTPL